MASFPRPCIRADRRGSASGRIFELVRRNGGVDGAGYCGGNGASCGKDA